MFGADGCISGCAGNRGQPEIMVAWAERQKAALQEGEDCMAAYKDEERGTWYVSFHYYDWTGKNKRKLKRGFKTRKEAL